MARASMKLEFWDRNAPLPESDEHTHCRLGPGARDTVMAAYACLLAPDMAEHGRSPSSTSGWIDAGVTPGKAPGAFRASHRDGRASLS